MAVDGRRRGGGLVDEFRVSVRCEGSIVLMGC